jgi:hypothetical protein
MGPGDARAFSAWPYTVLDYVTDADDTGDLAVAQHRHVSYAVARHQLHHATDTFVRGTVITPYRMISFTGIEVLSHRLKLLPLLHFTYSGPNPVGRPAGPALQV